MLLKKIWHKIERIAAKTYLRFYPKIIIIGITGSVGKTTTKEAIAQVLSEKFRVVKTQANIDPVFNIPRTILKLRPGDEKLVLEMGVEYPGEMDSYLSLVRPHIGVVTKIAWTHTEFFGDIKGVAEEKGKLLEALPASGWQVLNWDDEEVRKLTKKSQAQVFFYGTDESNCHLIAQDISTSKNGVSFLLKQAIKGGAVRINFPILGRHNVYCALAAASVGLLCGIKLEGIKRELEKLEPQPSRLNIVFGSSGSTIIDDSYNASPVGAVAAIETLKEYPGRRKIAVLGEMKELGSHSEMGHRQVGKTLVVAKIDYLVSFGELTKFVVDEAIKQGMKKDHIFQVKTMKEVIKVLKKIIRPGDVILLKGSRFSHMERVILGIEGKEINCDLVTCREYKPCSLCCKSKCSF